MPFPVTLAKSAITHGAMASVWIEVEEVPGNHPKFRFVDKGERDDENVYLALGRTDSGRYLAVIFIYKQTQEALILSARDMARKERKQHGKK